MSENINRPASNQEWSDHFNSLMPGRIAAPQGSPLAGPTLALSERLSSIPNPSRFITAMLSFANNITRIGMKVESLLDQGVKAEDIDAFTFQDHLMVRNGDILRDIDDVEFGTVANVLEGGDPAWASVYKTSKARSRVRQYPRHE